SRGTGGRRSGVGAIGPRWGVQDGRVAAGPLVADEDAGGWRMARPEDAGGWRMARPVVYGVPEPAADQPARFAALVTLRDHAGRQAMLQLEAAYPAEVDLEEMVRQALGQAARRGGWQVERWQPVTDAAVTAAGWEQAGDWSRGQARPGGAG